MTVFSELLDKMADGTPPEPAEFARLLKIPVPREVPPEDLLQVQALFRDRVRTYEHFCASRYESKFTTELLEEWIHRLLESLGDESLGSLGPGDWRSLMWDGLMDWKIAQGASQLPRMASEVERNVYLDHLPTFLLVGSRQEAWFLDEHAGRLGSIITDFNLPVLLGAFSSGLNRIDPDWLLEHRLGSSGWEPRNPMWSPDYAAIEILAHVWCRSPFEYQTAAYHLDVAEPERSHRRNLKNTLHMIEVQRRAEAEGLGGMSWESKLTILNMNPPRTFNLPLIQIPVEVPVLKTALAG